MSHINYYNYNYNYTTIIFFLYAQIKLKKHILCMLTKLQVSYYAFVYVEKFYIEIATTIIFIRVSDN